MVLSAAFQTEPLPGYTVVERIGSGGYGEVFRVEAPGGLIKALKVIHGYVDERRATEELKSLERIKGVRHPFLMSLERIEIVDGRVVVVMELAEGSVMDRFNANMHENSAGIPREELLRYLADAADALDFLCDVHGLQHLDVKPENLLLLAGHVKVGDFGMVKDLMKTGVSLVAGLTPYYAAPELFRGNPTRYSDQYSLAVLYQQMLCGALPFGGSSVAEIAHHHLNEEPDLSALPPRDRVVLARAFSKIPDRRYPTCRDMIGALRNSESSARFTGSAASDSASTPVKSATGDAYRAPVQHTTQALVVDEVTTTTTERKIIELSTLPDPVETVVSLDDVDAFEPTPTVFIGIGGTAARVLGHLRRRTAGRLGDPVRTPAFQTLLLDTDPTTLSDAVHAGGPSRLATEETLALMLRRPQDYRSSRNQHLRWINRRWLYNVPRSLRTDGLRPLGRLAFMDHAQQVTQRIAQVLRESTGEASLQATAEHTGIELQPGCVRVYLIASVSGGTGSGMVMDVAYAVKGLLATLELTHAEVCGVMLHSTSRVARASELAKINAFSWITEFNHFNRPGGSFVPDPSYKLFPLDEETRAFDRAYMSHMGHGLSESDFDAATDAVAEFVFQDCLTPASQFFSACHDRAAETTDDRSEQAELRTFGISWRSAIDEPLVDRMAADICLSVITAWLGSVDGAGEPQIGDALGHASPQEFILQEGLSPEAITQSNSRQMIATLGLNEKDFLERLAGDAEAHLSLVEAIDAVFWGPADRSDAIDGETGILEHRHDTLVDPHAEQRSRAIDGWIWSRFENQTPCLSAALNAAQWLERHFRDLESDIARGAADVGREIAAVRQAIHGESKQGAGRSVQKSHFAYFRLRLAQSGLFASIRYVRKLRSALRSTREELLETGRDVSAWMATVSSPADAESDGSAGDSRLLGEVNDQVKQDLESQREEIVSQSGRQFQNEFVQPSGGMRELLKATPGQRKAALKSLHDGVVSRITEIVNAVDLIDGIRPDNVSGGPNIFDQLLAESEPAGIRFCEQRRRLLVLPNSTATARTDAVKHRMTGKATCVEARQFSMVAACEGGPLSLPHLAYDIIDSRSDYADFATRVYTRNDVRFSPLPTDDSAGTESKGN